jgi:hypothetical protein
MATQIPTYVVIGNIKIKLDKNNNIGTAEKL